MTSELDEIKKRYEKRKNLPYGRMYGLSAPHTLYGMHEKERGIVDLLVNNSIDIESTSLLELGSGNGGNLLSFLTLGFQPQNLAGNDLIEERINKALTLLPTGVKLYAGDASSINLPNESFDIVYFSTVFSSILDDKLRVKVAEKAWNLLKPGGAILWYDFSFNNPKNQDVKGVKFKEIKELFPNAKKIQYKKITLAPPIARIVCRVYPSAYLLLNAFPFLRTHLMVWIEK